MFQVQSNRYSCTWTILTLDLTCIACFILSLNNLSAEFDGYMKREFLAVVLIHRKIELLGCWVFCTIDERNWLGVSAGALEKSTGLTVVTRNSFCPFLVQKLPEEKENASKRILSKAGGSIPNCFFESKLMFGSLLLTLGVSIRSHRAPWDFEDLKPENVFLSATGYVKVVEFSLAKVVNGRTQRKRLPTPRESHGNGPTRMKDDVG